jgi:hypothetical protein
MGDEVVFGVLVGFVDATTSEESLVLVMAKERGWGESRATLSNEREKPPQKTHLQGQANWQRVVLHQYGVSTERSGLIMTKKSSNFV